MEELELGIAELVQQVVMAKLEPHVLTYRLEFASGGFGLYEFFRGSQEQCIRIARACGGVASSDREQIVSCQAMVGTAQSWDEFLEEGMV